MQNTFSVTGFSNKCVRERMDARLNAMFMQREYFSLLSAAYNAPQHVPELTTTYTNSIIYSLFFINYSKI